MEHMFATYDTSSQSQEQEQEQQVNVSEPENTQHEDEEEEVEEDDKFEEMEDLGLICAGELSYLSTSLLQDGQYSPCMVLSVCMEPYDLPPSMKTPKALPCLHTFCLDCCNSLSRVPHSHFRTTTIACPQCRKVSPLPSGADGLPSNYALLSIIKRAPSSTSADLRYSMRSDYSRGLRCPVLTQRILCRFPGPDTARVYQWRAASSSNSHRRQCLRPRHDRKRAEGLH
eukprot:437853-Rhodomonas_salina.1